MASVYFNRRIRNIFVSARSLHTLLSYSSNEVLFREFASTIDIPRFQKDLL